MSIPEPCKARILVVDDDDGMLQVTRMSLRRVKYNGRKIDVLMAGSSQDALDILSREPGIGLMLIDGEMETPTAGLDTCQDIRERLGNAHLRIYLRTGKLEMDAEERAAKLKWDLEGHLPKGETSKDDLVRAVLAGLDAHHRLVARPADQDAAGERAAVKQATKSVEGGADGSRPEGRDSLSAY